MFPGCKCKSEVVKLDDNIVHKLAIAEWRHEHFDSFPPLYLFRSGIVQANKSTVSTKEGPKDFPKEANLAKSRGNAWGCKDSDGHADTIRFMISDNPSWRLRVSKLRVSIKVDSSTGINRAEHSERENTDSMI